MAKAKKRNQKRAKKADSRFYIVRTVEEARGELKGRTEDYRERFVNKPVKLSREFVEDLKDDPRNLIENIINDGKEFIEDMRTESRDKIDELVSDGKNLFKRMKKNPRKVVDGFVDDSRDFVSEIKSDTQDRVEGYLDEGKDIVDGIEKDVRLVIDDIIKNGKKAFKNYPMKKTIENNVTSRVKSFPSRLNIASRKEIENLMTGIETLNEKIETMSRLHV